MKFMSLVGVVVTAALVACGESQLSQDDQASATGGPVGQPSLCDWTQNMGTAQHVGKLCPELHGLRVAYTLRQDPDAKAEASDPNTGFLQIHEGSPLTSGDFVAVPVHRGANPLDRSGDTWAVDLWRWMPSVTAANAHLTHVTLVSSTWQAVDSIRSFGFVTNGYVQQMPAAFSLGSLYVPLASAKLAKVDPATGTLLATIDPFVGTAFDGDARLTTAGGISVRADGTLYYSATAWPLGAVRTGLDPRGSWLIEVNPTGSTRIAPWTQIASTAVGVPQRNDACNWPFGTAGTPDATGPDSVPPVFGCGFQRPKLNGSVAIRPTDNHLMVYSAGNNNIWSGWIIDVDPVTLLPVRAMATREHFLQGCGVRIPLIGSPDFGDVCDVITNHGAVHLGFDPDFNLPGSLRGDGIDASDVFCRADGDCGVGGYDGGFAFFGGTYDARGVIVVFHPDGSVASINLDDGWEITPAVDANGNYRMDRNQFSDAFDAVTGTIGQSANKALQSAVYSQGFELIGLSQIPVDFSANAIDLLSAQEPVDIGGGAYTVDANGHLYQLDAAGNVVDFVALPDPDTGDAALSQEGMPGYYARDRAGRLYASYAGWVYVIEGTGAARRAPLSRQEVAALRAPSSARLVRAMQMKAASAALAPIPPPPQ